MTGAAMLQRRLRVLALLVAVVLIGGLYARLRLARQLPLRVGILHSLHGTMSLSEAPLIDAYRMAADEINANGGVLGRRIELVEADGKSDPAIFEREAERLITEERVSAIFGCWTSASHRTVKPVVEKYQHVLFYPVEYEGLVDIGHVVYTGALPNQQVIPGVTWLYLQGKRRFYLVGSDYVFPRCANAIAKEQIKALGGEVVGDTYLPLGSAAVDDVIADIVKTKPDAILNTINGDSVLPFFKKLRAAGITPEKIPTMSTSIGENELNAKNMKLIQDIAAQGGLANAGYLLDVADTVGDYAVWNYFQTLPGAQNNEFVSRFKARYGSDRVLSDPMEAAYFGVYLWARAVADAGTDAVASVLEKLRRQSFLAPEGVVFIDPDSLHTWKTVRIGKIEENGQFRIVWDSETPIRPVPYPIYKPRKEWNEFVDGLYQKWGRRWAGPTAN
jgi:urea transport system substrate-binding protein